MLFYRLTRNIPSGKDGLNLSTGTGGDIIVYFLQREEREKEYAEKLQPSTPISRFTQKRTHFCNINRFFFFTLKRFSVK